MTEFLHAAGVQPIQRRRRPIRTDVAFDRRHQLIKGHVVMGKSLNRIGARDLTVIFEPINQGEKLRPEFQVRIGLVVLRDSLSVRMGFAALNPSYLRRAGSADGWILNLRKWCPEEDSNLHASRRQYLKLVRLPIPPSGHWRHT